MADANDDRFNLKTGGDPYNLSKGQDPFSQREFSPAEEAKYDAIIKNSGLPSTQNGGASGIGQNGGGSGQGSSASSKDQFDKDGLPSFDSRKTYLVKGLTLNRFVALIKRNKPKATTGGGVKVAQETSDGTFFAIDADELKLSVCIGGVATTKTFYVKRTAGS